MANSINRRSWIKSTALLAGGAAFFSGTITKLAAMPKKFRQTVLNDRVADQVAALESPPIMKARLLANENPFGPSAAAKKAMQQSLDTSYQYPFMHMKELTSKISAHEGIREENLIMDAGSSPLLLASAMFYGKNGAEILTGDPTYNSLPADAETLGAKWIKVPLTADYQFDLDAIEAKVNSNTGLVYICNPNNPTGTILDTAKLKAFCERVSKKVPVFVDEAYIDYLPDPKGASMASLVNSGSNIIVARTFSKLYGFAGMRCGYIIAQPETVKTLAKYVVGNMSISAPTLAAAIAGYQEKEFLADALKKTLASKEYLYSVLKKEGYDYIPSSANFVMFPLKMEGSRFAKEMMNRGVGVRFWKFNDKEWCRVSIGRMDEMEAFAEAFKQLS